MNTSELAGSGKDWRRAAGTAPGFSPQRQNRRWLVGRPEYIPPYVLWHPVHAACLCDVQQAFSYGIVQGG